MRLAGSAWVPLVEVLVEVVVDVEVGLVCAKATMGSAMSAAAMTVLVGMPFSFSEDRAMLEVASARAAIKTSHVNLRLRESLSPGGDACGGNATAQSAIRGTRR